ncbi:MAG: hypothetical protein WBA31_11190 [Candidatus Dormiibacterota bacterium]
MTGQCMSGMVMPGCASYAPALRTGAGPSLIKPLLIIAVVLAAFSATIFILRLLLRSRIRNYSSVSDLLGHVLPAAGLAAMSLLTIGTLRSLGPLLLYTAGFTVLAAVLLIRAVTHWDTARLVQDLWVLLLALTMAYVFSAASIVPLTVLVLLLSLAFVGEVLRRGGLDSQLPTVNSPGRRILSTLGSNGEVALAIALVLLLAVSQWPRVFT